jgi:hypothetical protein
VLDVLEHFAKHGRVECPVGKREVGHVCLGDRTRDPRAEEFDRGGGCVDARHVEAAVGKPEGEAARSRAGVQDLRARLAREEEVEQEPLAQLMTWPDELRGRSPLVLRQRSSAISDRQRAPRTASLARSS